MLFISVTQKPSRLVPLLLALAVNQAYAGPVGTAGTAGSNGVSPGAAGTAGGAGGNVSVTLNNGSAFLAERDQTTGGGGGNGGNGAAGDIGQSGGAAGAGGAGGTASLHIASDVLWTGFVGTNYSIRGGKGGDAGTGGAAGSGANAGSPAAGGDGGAAEVRADLVARGRNPGLWQAPYFTAEAVGGKGGAGNTAGVGGAASTQVNVTGTGSAHVGSASYGGTGGDAIAAGNGGAGGNATFTGVGVSSGPLEMNMSSSGGNGGAGVGYGYQGGHGGTASGTLQADVGSADLSSTVHLNAGSGGVGRGGALAGAGGDIVVRTPATLRTTGALSMSTWGEGGDGGDGYGTNGGAGGNADVGIVLDDKRAARVNVHAVAIGGRGGNAFSDVAALRVGSGGTAKVAVDVTARGTLDVAAYSAAGSSIYDRSTPAGIDGTTGSAAIAHGRGVSTEGSSSVSAKTTGGAGGMASGTGKRAGDGGSATATTHSQGLTSATANVQVEGGWGGIGWAGATGGTGAAVTLVNAVTGATNGMLTLEQAALAGHGGNSYGGQEGNGGAAISRLTLRETTAHTVNADIRAVGGKVGDIFNTTNTKSGNGGAAEATLVLHADKAGSVASGYVQATGGGWERMPVDTIAKAGNAVASSVVQADKSASSQAFADGGVPPSYLPKQSGNGDAFARAVSNHEATARAKGTGTVSVVRAEAVGGTGTTSALATGRATQATVSAYSSALGAAGNTAQAEAYGVKTTVRAESVSNGPANTRVATTSSTVQKDSVHDTTRSGASVGGQIYALPQQFAPEETSSTYNMTYATTYATALPETGAAKAALAATPAVAAAFNGGQIIGMGLASGVAYSPSKPVNYSGITTANFQFDTTSGGMLTLGLLDSLTYLSGFSKLELSISNHGTEIFTQTFTSLQNAELFFNDRVLNLGMLAAGSQDLLVTTGFTLTRPSGFGFTYALGISAVPEPQTWLLLLLGTSVILLRQRRRQ